MFSPVHCVHAACCPLCLRGLTTGQLVEQASGECSTVYYGTLSPNQPRLGLILIVERKKQQDPGIHFRTFFFRLQWSLGESASVFKTRIIESNRGRKSKEHF